eukprot:CAMPEP_0204901728 /NCGR_PEP_ID=MMETSP1397-20131031/3250_1 /ASSEMBLY_ACC=CAM_ASM_000891 /TAXON_ID=49980 /ORGANISM="Climacostomum Climacostomum virens, Strain Stock W-24" /LENGTH=124 /DNA_ID=CAMNT_0052070127 /DNA_START=195 /DNA_END=569 /DNA_ORIENTATION=-
MSLEEVLALCMPSKPTDDWAADFAKKVEDVPMICLSCYADIVRKQSAKRRTHFNRLDLEPPTTPKTIAKRSTSSRLMTQGTQRSRLTSRLPQLKQALAPSEVPSVTASSYRRRGKSSAKEGAVK